MFCIWEKGVLFRNALFKNVEFCGSLFFPFLLSCFFIQWTNNTQTFFSQFLDWEKLQIQAYSI